MDTKFPGNCLEFSKKVSYSVLTLSGRGSNGHTGRRASAAARVTATPDCVHLGCVKFRAELAYVRTEPADIVVFMKISRCVSFTV